MGATVEKLFKISCFHAEEDFLKNEADTIETSCDIFILQGPPGCKLSKIDWSPKLENNKGRRSVIS